MSDCIALILAAGKGSRMRSDKPKVLHTVGGQPILSHVIDAANSCCDEVVVIYGHGGEQVKAALIDYECTWVQQAEQLGTGHAVLQALPHLDQAKKVVILSGDVPLLKPSTLKDFLNHTGDNSLSVMTVNHSNPEGLGRIIRDDNNQLLAIVEHKDASAQQKEICEINAGIYCTSVAILSRYIDKLSCENAQNEYYLTDIVELALADGVQVNGYLVDEQETLGINTKVQLHDVERVYQKRRATELLNNGTWVRDINRLDIRGELGVENNVEIDINVIFEGKVHLGRNVRIGANTVIKNTVIAEDTIIKENCVIENAVIGRGCQIGPFARVRPDTTLEDFARLGNFVETKKSTIGKGAKVNHLSYIGDCTIGERANIGAGTITCNYDGVNKHQTTVGAGAFIGSNTALIAPVTVGDNATVGAGSVISRDAPSDQLTLSRAPQRTIAAWNRKEKE